VLAYAADVDRSSQFDRREAADHPTTADIAAGSARHASE
jgi:hypothetical protein